MDITDIKNIAHKMKGTALSACFEILGRQLGRLETVDANANAGEITVMASLIRDEIDYLNAMES